MAYARSRGAAFALIAIVASMFVGSPASAQDIFRDGFESGATPWTHLVANGAVVTSGCRTGAKCIQMTLPGGGNNQGIFLEKDVVPDYAGQTFYMEGFFRFPAGYTWDPSGAPLGLEHKMFIINTVSNVGRVLVNLRGGGNTPTLQVHAESLESLGNGISKYSTVKWPADDRYHRLGVELTRVPGTSARLRLWLDNTLALDETGRLCGSSCSPIRDVWVGAYSNQGAPVTQRFYMDDVVLSASPREAVTAPVVTPPPPTTARVEALEAIATAGEALDAAQAALVQAVEALEEQ